MLLLIKSILGNIIAMSSKGYSCIEAPVGIGSNVYLDTTTSISSMDPWLRSQRLSGIRTAKADSSATSLRFLQFDVDRACVVYLCWDMRVRSLPKWINKWGFQASGLLLQTTVTTHIVLYRSYNANRRIVLGGCGMKTPVFENYIVLIGDALSSVAHTFNTKVNPCWRLRPGTEVYLRSTVTSESQSFGAESDTSDTNRVLGNDIMAPTQVHIMQSIRFDFEGHTFRVDLHRGTSLLPVLSIHAKESLIDASFDIIGTMSFQIPHRQDSAQIYLSCAHDIVYYIKSEPMYLLEPLNATFYWNKVANNINQTIKCAAMDSIGINVHPDGISSLYEYYQNNVSAIMSKKYAYPNPSGAKHSDFDKSQSDKSTIVIYNYLGVDIRMWITGAVFLEPEKELLSQPSADTAEEEDSFSQQTLVLAGTFAIVILQDPLPMSSDKYDDCLRHVSIDIAIDGWCDVPQVQLRRQGEQFYPIYPPEARDESTVLNKTWRTLSDSSIQEHLVSPMVRWKSDPKLNAVEDTSVATRDIFFAGFTGKKKRNPFALKVRYNMSASNAHDVFTLRVDLSSNITFKNLSGDSIDIFCDDFVNADIPLNTKSLFNRIECPADLSFNNGVDSQKILCKCGDSVVLPLPILRDLSIHFSPTDSRALKNMSIPLREELFDVNIPSSLRRSADTDLFGVVISNSSDCQDANEDRVSWEICLPPCMTFVNATFASLIIQVMQPPNGDGII